MRHTKTNPVEPADNRKSAGSAVNIPIAREELDVSKKTVKTGTVRVRKIVREHEELVDLPLLREEVEVKRVSINRVIDGPVAARYEGELLILPVLEEVLVVQKQWVLKEELHISKRTVETHSPQSVTLRSEEAIVDKSTGG